MSNTSSSARFASPELLSLGPPPNLASVEFEILNDQALADLAARMSLIGIDKYLTIFESDPAVALTESAVSRDLKRRAEIDYAVAQTFLGSATGAMLDQRAADYGVLRKVVTPVTATTAAVMEDDESLRTRVRLAWEALSVAGPSGAYVFHAMEAHPGVLDAAVYGPESDHVAPGEVLVVVQSRTASGVPSLEVLDSVAARLDAAEVIYGTGASRSRDVRDEQSVRPLGARVIVKASQPVTFYVSARLFIRPGPDPEIIRQTAVTRLSAYLTKRRRIGAEIPRSGIIAALHIADANGLPIVEEVELLWPTADVTPRHDELAVVSTISVEAVIR